MTAKEYAKFRQSTSTDYYKFYKTHKGLQYQSCVTDDTHILYVYEDGGFDKYKVIARIDYIYEDVAIAIMGVLSNAENYEITGVINDILETLEIRRSGYSVYNAYTKKRSGSRGDGSLLERTSKPLTRGTDESGGRFIGNKRGIRPDGGTNGEVNESKNNFSLKDSEGNTLTEAQAEFFKDSKVRDENGNLIVMYQGANEDFTVFDRKKSSYANLYGSMINLQNQASMVRIHKKKHTGQLIVLKDYLGKKKQLYGRALIQAGKLKIIRLDKR